jgi:hypothetical protein
MSATKVKYSKPVPLLVDAKGFQDGRAVLFEIWKETGGKKEKIDEVNGVVRREKGIGSWEPKSKRENQLPLKDKISPQPQKEQYSFIARIDKGTDQEKKVEGTPIEFTYPLEIYLTDEKGIPMGEIECAVTFSDGNKEKGMFKNGCLKLTDVPSGKFNLELENYDFIFEHRGKIINARWEKERDRFGEEIKMIVDVEGFEEGDSAKFAIWERDIDGKNNCIANINGKVQGKKVEVFWINSRRGEEENLEEEVDDIYTEYFFEVDVKGEKANSGTLKFSYPLDISLVDENGKKLENVQYTITFSDGTKRKGRFKEGHAKIEDAPYGKFTLEVEGFDLIYGES